MSLHLLEEFGRLCSCALFLAPATMSKHNEDRNVPGAQMYTTQDNNFASNHCDCIDLCAIDEWFWWNRNLFNIDLAL